MTAREALAIQRRWQEYRIDKPVSNKILASFYRDEIQQDPALRQINAFEVLDSITNAAQRGPATR